MLELILWREILLGVSFFQQHHQHIRRLLLHHLGPVPAKRINIPEGKYNRVQLKLNTMASGCCREV